MILPGLLTRSASVASAQYRGDILPFLDGTNDGDADVNGVITVPDGIYSLGGAEDVCQYDGTVDDGVINIHFERSTPIFLQAETKGGVIVDLNWFGQTTMQIASVQGTSFTKLVLSGFHFRNGSILPQSVRRVGFYYCTHERSRRNWYDDAWSAIESLGYDTLTASDRDPFGLGRHIYGPGTGSPQVGLTEAQWDAVIGRMCYPFGPIRVEAPDGANFDLRWLGCDITESPDDGIFLGATFDPIIQGCRIWGVTEFQLVSGTTYESVDPGHTQAQPDWFHNDHIQINTGGVRPSILDCWLGGRIMWNKLASGNGDWDVDFRRIWFGGERDVPGEGGGYSTSMTLGYDSVADAPFDSRHGFNVSITVDGASHYTGNLRNCTHFSNGTAAFIVETGAATWPGDYNVTFSQNTESSDGTTYSTASASGQTLTPAISDLFDVDEIRDHALNPANVWRDSNPWTEANMLSAFSDF